MSNPLWSLPARGAWIEIADNPDRGGEEWSLPARGAWIEIWNGPQVMEGQNSRSPQGERGLKSPNKA